jgi:phosphatidylglycerophosphate synthase
VKRSADELVDRLGDPLNRLYRYPAANLTLKLFGWLPLRPNHVTLIHTLVGVGASVLVAFGSGVELVVAFFLLELRMVLDCYDGVLARHKQLSSPRGRALDELGDGVAYLAFVSAMSIRAAREIDIPVALGLFVVMMVLGALSAHGCDFFKRRLTGLLRGEPDAVAAELARKKALVARGESRWLDRFGVWFDGWQVRLFEPSKKDAEPSASHPVMWKLVLAVSLLSWDNALALLHVGVLTSRIFEACAIAIGYGLVLGTTTILLSRRVLGGRK